MKLSPLTANDFPAFFFDVWGIEPFPWQTAFARRLSAGETPAFVTVPTGSGKTACIDAAVFALAVQAARPFADRTQGRRIFFIVNRRLIVDEAYERAGKLCAKLLHASADSPTGRVATALRTILGDSKEIPLACVQLRGGVYRDRTWTSSLLQPLIVCSTVDQAGSRLLFRGYGVSEEARPIHASMVAQDSLLLIDEAHISRPFTQTLDWVARYRLHRFQSEETVSLPFRFIQMTATPPPDVNAELKVTLGDADYQHPILRPRLTGQKPARLAVELKAKGKTRNEAIARRAADEAEDILTKAAPRSIAIMVNRVATARAVAKKLESRYAGLVKLVIGRLRPIDRETITREIQSRLKTRSAGALSGDDPLIVVSTQCLEVGADLDFDALVTEAASLDALRQRFGRLNRGGRAFTPSAAIILPGDRDVSLEKLSDENAADPIYGNAITHTWRWLNSISDEGSVDFGISAMDSRVEALRAADPEALTTLLTPTRDAPVLLPAYLDCWAQTSPTPAADPDVALFLHGPQREMTDVHVCWRGDLPNYRSEEDWTDTIGLCPPTTLECLPVPLKTFRAWLSSPENFQDDSSDVAELTTTPHIVKADERRDVLAFVWRKADESFFAEPSSNLRPEDVIVLRAQDGGWAALGHLPNAPEDPQNEFTGCLSSRDLQRVDVAELASADARRRAVLRICPALWPESEHNSAAALLRRMAMDSEQNWDTAEIQMLLTDLVREENSRGHLSESQRTAALHLVERKPQRVTVEPYPNKGGFVISTRDLLPVLNAKDDGATDLESDSLLSTAKPQELAAHTQDVLDRLHHTLAKLPLDPWREALVAAANLHDCGKADPRFQALLLGTSPFAAMASKRLLAKSGSLSPSIAAQRAAHTRAQLPPRFRHELLSVQLADLANTTSLPEDNGYRMLVLYLIGTHHGYARPFAPVTDDPAPPDISLVLNGDMIDLSSADRACRPVHALDSGVADRFWQMIRRHGWWGLPFLESVLRIADQSASANPTTFETK